MEPDYRILAKKMYDAYCAAVGGVAHDGKPLPRSKEFFNDASKRKQSNAWDEAAKVALDFTEKPSII